MSIELFNRIKHLQQQVDALRDAVEKLEMRVSPPKLPALELPIPRIEPRGPGRPRKE
jgi:hypothetical protein